MERKDMRRIDKLFVQLKMVSKDISDIYRVYGLGDDNLELNKLMIKFEQLVNKTFPINEIETNMKDSIEYFMRFGRDKLIKYLFDIQQASLLLFINGVTIARALGVYNILLIQSSNVDEKHYVVMKHIPKQNNPTLTKKQKRNKNTKYVNGSY
jgi:hypothetical protein